MNNIKFHLVILVSLNYHQVAQMQPFLSGSGGSRSGSLFNLKIKVNPDQFSAFTLAPITLSPEAFKNWNGSFLELNNVTISETEACPPPIGVDPPPGCDKTFVEDVNGTIPCKDDLDCPENKEWFNENGCQDESEEIITVGHCSPRLKKCKYLPFECKKDGKGWRLSEYIPPEGDDNQQNKSGGWKPNYVTAVAGVTVKSSCKRCQEMTSCPPNKPCKSGDNCYRARCNRRGRCWCTV